MSLQLSDRSPRSRAAALALALLVAACGGGGEGETQPEQPSQSTQPTDPAGSKFVPPPQFAAEVNPESFIDPPAERAPIDGIDGFHAVSAVDYASLPGVPHRFDFVYVFPDRVRWSIVQHADYDSGFILDYQYGGHRYRKMPGWPGSTELTGLSLAQGIRQMDIRLAMMMYPHSHEWGPEQELDGEPTRVTELGGDAGAIRVTLGADGKPVRFTAIAADGKDMESLIIETWQEVEGRSWPLRVRLEAEGQVITEEIIKGLTTRLNLVEQYFLPVDFNELPEVRREFDDTVRVTPLPPMVIRTEPLPAGTTWADARAAESARRAEWSSAELPLNDFVSFGIDEQGQPLSFFVRLADGSPATDGYTSLPQRRATTLFVRSLDSVTAEHVAALRSALPQGATAHDMYLSWPSSMEGSRVQLVLPFDL